MHPTRTRFRHATLLAVVFAAACDATGPRADGPLAPDFAASSVSAGPAGYLPGWSASSEGALKPVLEREKARIELEKKQSASTYKLAKWIWDAYKKSDYERFGSRFVLCEPQQYAAETKIIGPAGGEIEIGPHTLRIPKGALSQYTVITGEAPVTSAVEVRFSPHGLHFLKQPMLTLNYKRCAAPGDTPHRAGYVDDAENVLEWPVSYDEKRVNDLYTWIWHFSGYRILKGYTPAGG